MAKQNIIKEKKKTNIRNKLNIIYVPTDRYTAAKRYQQSNQYICSQAAWSIEERDFTSFL